MAEFFGPKEDREHTLRHIAGLTQPITEDEQRIIAEKTEALKILFGMDQKPIVAKHKIELIFGQGRSVMTHFPGQLTVWKSGSRLDGSGDEVMYACPSQTCAGYIPPELIGRGKAACPKCRKAWRQADLKEHVLARLTHQNWATLVARVFIRLQHDADIYVKTSFSDIRDATLREQAKAQHGELLTKARVALIPVIYPMANLYKDLSNGADLYQRIYAFLKA